MKKLCTILLKLMTVNTNAQLLKKIKDKTQQIIEPKNGNEQQTRDGQSKNNSTVSNKTSAKWVPTPDCEKVFTLAKGETFLFDETRIITKSGKMSYAFVVSNRNYEYFLIEDGKRTGSFKEPPVNELQIKSVTEEGGGKDDETIELNPDKKDPVPIQYSKTINNKLYLVFNGKTYGPFDYVARMRVSPDKKKFWAAVIIGGSTDMMAKMGMGNNYLINEAGVKQKEGSNASFPVKLMISSTFSAAALTILDNGAQKAVIISSTGKKQEASINEIYTGNASSTTVADNGDIISIPSQSPTQLMVNGKEEAVFKVPVTSIHRLFIMPDYKKSVYYHGGKLYRGDGSEEALTAVVFPRFVTISNQPTICYFKIHETETADKDVYICKKIL